ncbi:MAG: 4'-phosphopantetheinyl transferase superfamily protein, partial [Clostridia bacterium]|nr:4'-phosphopantetheinyl transferase superfamily protein [Clostridia bacterium]
LFRSMPILNVYVCPIFEREIDLSCVYPTERANQISECSNKKVRLEKYLVWKLLEYALEHTFGKKITDVKFKKEPTGKWTCNFCEFSLSHTDGAVAVAISRKAVGVDIEGLKKLKSQTVFDRILSEDEKKLLANSSNEQKERLFYEFWTKKESAFKQLNKNTCEYKKLPTLSQRVKTQTININDNSYILSVASDCLEKLKLFTVDLK